MPLLEVLAIWEDEDYVAKLGDLINSLGPVENKVVAEANEYVDSLHPNYAAVAPTRGSSLPIPPPVYEDLILEVLATRLFRNIIIQKWNISSDLLNQHRTMLERTDEVLKMLR